MDERSLDEKIADLLEGNADACYDDNPMMSDELANLAMVYREMGGDSRMTIKHPIVDPYTGEVLADAGEEIMPINGIVRLWTTLHSMLTVVDLTIDDVVQFEEV